MDCGDDHGKRCLYYGDGKTSRDFCFVENAVQMNILAATAADSVKDNVYNVAVGDRISLNQLYKTLQTTLIDLGINVNKKPIYRDFRVGDVRHSQANITKAVSKLNYQPDYKILAGIKKAMPWYICNHASHGELL